MSCVNQIKLCAFSKGLCDFAGREEECPNCNRCSQDTNVPTIAELCELYKTAAENRRMHTEQISPADVRKSLACISLFLEYCGVSESDPMTNFNRRRLTKFADALREKGLAKASIKTYLVSIQRTCARWARAVYEDAGYDVPPIDIPEMGNVGGEYVAPSKDRQVALKLWYNGLASSSWRIGHIYAMLVYHFGMRNGDVDLLTWDAFSDDRGMRILTYEPHKTRLKTHRIVRIEVSDVDWFHLSQFRDSPTAREYVIPGGGRHYGIRASLNKQLRDIGFSGAKGIYELRKACGDAYARRFGVDMAKAILGHRMVTGSTAHYVDGSANIVPTIWG